MIGIYKLVSMLYALFQKKFQITLSLLSLLSQVQGLLWKIWKLIKKEGDKIPIVGLGVVKGEPGRKYMMLKSVI